MDRIEQHITGVMHDTNLLAFILFMSSLTADAFRLPIKLILHCYVRRICPGFWVFQSNYALHVCSCQLYSPPRFQENCGFLTVRKSAVYRRVHL